MNLIILNVYILFAYKGKNTRQEFVYMSINESKSNQTVDMPDKWDVIYILER